MSSLLTLKLGIPGDWLPPEYPLARRGKSIDVGHLISDILKIDKKKLQF